MLDSDRDRSGVALAHVVEMPQPRIDEFIDEHVHGVPARRVELQRLRHAGELHPRLRQHQVVVDDRVPVGRDVPVRRQVVAHPQQMRLERAEAVAMPQRPGHGHRVTHRPDEGDAPLRISNQDAPPEWPRVAQSSGP